MHRCETCGEEYNWIKKGFIVSDMVAKVDYEVCGLGCLVELVDEIREALTREVE